MFRSYLRLALFAFGLLVGIQIPGFIDDYIKRVDAHRIEVQQSLEGFRNTANKHFNGSLDALLGHYLASDDPVFQSDADSIERLVRRGRLFEDEWRAMQRPWYAQALHLMARADGALLEETYRNYSYQILLQPAAIAWAIGCGLLLAWLVEALLVLLGAITGFGSRGRPAGHMR